MTAEAPGQHGEVLHLLDMAELGVDGVDVALQLVAQGGHASMLLDGGRGMPHFWMKCGFTSAGIRIRSHAAKVTPTGLGSGIAIPSIAPN